MASPVRSPRSGAPASPACASVNATASRLATPAPRSTASAAAREASSARAVRAVAAASAPAIVAHTQITKTAAAASSAPSAATDHVAPTPTASAAVITPRTNATTTRFAARPEWSRGLSVTAESGGSVMAGSQRLDRPPRWPTAAIRLAARHGGPQSAPDERAARNPRTHPTPGRGPVRDYRGGGDRVRLAHRSRHRRAIAGARGRPLRMRRRDRRPRRGRRHGRPPRAAGAPAPARPDPAERAPGARGVPPRAGRPARDHPPDPALTPARDVGGTAPANTGAAPVDTESSCRSPNRDTALARTARCCGPWAFRAPVDEASRPPGRMLAGGPPSPELALHAGHAAPPPVQHGHPAARGDRAARRRV